VDAFARGGLAAAIRSKQGQRGVNAENNFRRFELFG